MALGKIANTPSGNLFSNLIPAGALKWKNTVYGLFAVGKLLISACLAKKYLSTVLQHKYANEVFISMPMIQ